MPLCQDRASGLKAVIAHPLDRPGPRARRHPLLPVRLDEAEAVADVAEPLPRHDLQERHGRASTTAAARPSSSATPSTDQERGAAARLRPVRRAPSAAATSPPATSAPTSPTWTCVARECRWTSPAAPPRTAARATPPVLTAFGVFQGMRPRPSTSGATPDACAAAASASPGVGKVGHHLGRAPARATAPRSWSPTSTEDAVGGSPRSHPSAWSLVADTDGADPARGSDVYAPCALGGALERRHGRGADRARCVCGARQQPARPPRCREGPRRPRHPLRAGLRGERRRCHPGRRRAARTSTSSACEAKAAKIYDTTLAIFARAEGGRYSAGRRGRPDRRAADGRGTGPAVPDRPLGGADLPAARSRRLTGTRRRGSRRESSTRPGGSTAEKSG